MTQRFSALETQSPWLADALQGDPVAFDRLVRPLLGSLLALARRLARGGASGEELLQAALIRAYKGLAGFRGECSFRSWLVGILYRLAAQPERLTGQGKGLPALLTSDELDRAVPDSLAADPLTRVTARDLLDRVEEAMERLPVRQRTALHLRAVETWSYAEIARVLATTPGAARMAVLAARNKLRQRLGGLL